MKKILLSLSALLLTTASFAIPARPGIWRTLTLTNGTQVRAQLQGDEHLNYYEDAEGNTYTENADGTFYAFNLNEAQERVKTRLNKMRATAAAKTSAPCHRTVWQLYGQEALPHHLGTV